MVKILFIDRFWEEFKEYKFIFHQKGFKIYFSKIARDGLKLAEEIKPQFIFLEIELDEINGIELCAEIRSNPKFERTVLVIFSNRWEDYLQIAALKSGADDYILKSLNPRVLFYKIEALIKRFFPELLLKNNIIKFGDFFLDKDKYLFLKGKEEIFLPRKEFELMILLSGNPGKIFSRYEIFYAIWGSKFDRKNRTVDVHIRKLRKKIGMKYIATVKGVGYCFKS